MTDRYTELVKAAYEAQQAREGEAYQALTAKLTDIDGQLRNLAYQRETTVVDLEAMDDAVEAAKEALDAYFAGRDEDEPGDDTEVIESDDALFEPVEAPISNGLTGMAYKEWLRSQSTGSYFGEQMNAANVFEPLATEEDEYASAKANGALS